MVVVMCMVYRLLPFDLKKSSWIVVLSVFWGRLVQEVSSSSVRVRVMDLYMLNRWRVQRCEMRFHR